MKTKFWVLTAIILAILFTSCSNGLKVPKKTTVSFYMDKATVKSIIKASAKSAKSVRAAEDSQEPADDSEEPEEPAQVIDTENYYIDVTLYGEIEETKTSSLDGEVNLEFEEVPLNTRVYAKAQVYTFLDSEKTKKQIIFRGESSTITVREGTNVLNLKLEAAPLTITFETNGGSEIAAQTVTTGSCAAEPENPVKPAGKKAYNRENYAFAGWFTDEELTKAYDFSLPVKDDLTLYAKWIEDFVFVQGSTVNDYLVTGRKVKINDLYISDHEVTQAEYKAVTNKNPSKNTGAKDLPVENVTWFDALAYCNNLSIKEGLTPCYKINDSTDPNEWGELTAATPVSCSLSSNGYRLPTEAEWEYIAAKAKRDTDLSNIAWTSDNSNDKTHPVKYNLADELCLCDILGNVAEWCYDIYSDSITKTTGASGPMPTAGTDPKRVVRGGSYKSENSACSSSARAYANPTSKNEAIGFRVVRTVVYDFKVVKDTVTFDSDGGTEIDVQIIVEGDCASEPAAPAKRGYIFKGWQYGDDAFNFATPVTQDITLTAKWQPITYTVKFNYNAEQVSGGSGTVTEYAATYDQNIQLPAASTITAPTGWHFSKWSTASDPAAVDLEYDPENPQIKNLAITQGAEVTLYAIWEENGKHTITYNNVNFPGVDISALKKDYREAEAVNLQAQVPSGTRTGYTFEGWFDSSDIDGNGTGNEVINWAVGEKTADVVVYARWIANTYGITYELNGGAWKDGYTAPVEYTYGVALNLPDANKVIKAGYGLYWFTTPAFDEGTEVTEIAAGTIDNPFKVYAKWVAGAVNYTVHHMQQNLDDDNYTEVTDDIQTLSGITAENTNATAKTYTGFTAQTITQVPIAGDNSTEVTIYYDRNVHTVTYANGLDEDHGIAKHPTTHELLIPNDNSGNPTTPEGVPTTTENFRYGKTVTVKIDTKPTFQGYKFNGWIGPDGTIYSETSGWSSFVLGDSDVVLTATWQADDVVKYNIKYKKQKADSDDYDITSAYGYGTTGEMTSISFNSQDFPGFTLHASITQQVVLPDESTVVEVYLDRKTYTVVYNKNAGTETVSNMPTTDTTDYRYEANITLQNVTPTRTGYTFAGWTTVAEPTDSDPVYTYGGTAPQMVPADPDSDTTMTLYAKWTVETQGTGIDVGFGVDTTTIEVTAPTGNGSIFMAPTDYDSYSWTVDGEEKSTVRLLDMFNFATVPGVYDITLTATKTVNGNTVTHTWTGQYIKN